MRYAVIGANGQLGRDLCRLLGDKVIALSRDRGDLTRPESLRGLLAEIDADVVLNCAAYNFVDKAESEPEAAFAVNAWAVRDLARICRDLDKLLVHFSTDYVFGLDTGRDTPWLPTDAPAPNSVYSLSKLAGEYLVRAECPRHLVIRTCGLYGVAGLGSKKGNFVETMLRVGGQGKPLRVVNDQECTPSYTADLARGCVELIEGGQRGLHHVTSSGSCTWYTFAQAIFEQAGMKVDLTPITTAEFNAAAGRPAYSVLANETCQLRPWQEALGDYLRERQTLQAVAG